MPHGLFCTCSFCVITKKANSKVNAIVYCARYVKSGRYD